MIKKPGISTIDDKLVDNKFDERFTNILSSLKMPQRWKSENVESPTRDCLHWAKQTLGRLATQYGMTPNRVAYSVEGGIFVAYLSPDGTRVLNLEIDNDIDVVATISEGKAVLESVVMEDENDLAVLNAFFS